MDAALARDSRGVVRMSNPIVKLLTVTSVCREKCAIETPFLTKCL